MINGFASWQITDAPQEKQGVNSQYKGDKMDG